MSRTCYRCEAPVEDQTTFCPACGAPQIKVATPADALASQPASAPLPPGTPDSIQPPAIRLPAVPAGQILWNKFWRVALPLSVISAAVILFSVLFGVVLFLVSLIVGVIQYRREHNGTLRASQGARLGVVMGLVASTAVAIFFAVYTSQHFSDLRQQALQNLQQRMGSNPDPQVQLLMQWAATDRGFVVLSIFSVALTIIFLVVTFTIVGALTAFSTGSKRR